VHRQRCESGQDVLARCRRVTVDVQAGEQPGQQPFTNGRERRLTARSSERESVAQDLSEPALGELPGRAGLDETPRERRQVRQCRC
jgi:hypothetical protein